MFEQCNHVCCLHRVRFRLCKIPRPPPWYGTRCSAGRKQWQGTRGCNGRSLHGICPACRHSNWCQCSTSNDSWWDQCETLACPSSTSSDSRSCAQSNASSDVLGSDEATRCWSAAKGTPDRPCRETSLSPQRVRRPVDMWSSPEGHWGTKDHQKGHLLEKNCPESPGDMSSMSRSMDGYGWWCNLVVNIYNGINNFLLMFIHLCIYLFIYYVLNY